MTDVFDRAAEVEEVLRQDALDKQLRRAGLDGKTVNDSALSCGACTEPIPQARREALPGVQTCVECQAELERATNGKAH